VTYYVLNAQAFMEWKRDWSSQFFNTFGRSYKVEEVQSPV